MSSGGIAELTPLAGPSQAVAFTEYGLPAATLSRFGWTVELNGTTHHSSNTTITFSVPNGTYPWLVSGPYAQQIAGLKLSNGSLLHLGTLSVAGATSVSVDFVGGVTPALAFRERGLPPGLTWCDALDGETLCSSSSVVRFANLTPGSFQYAVVSPLVGQVIIGHLGSTPIPTRGNVTVAANQTLGFSFKYPYVATFTATGIPAGTSWSVTVRGVTRTNVTPSSIVFELPNGTYGFHVAVPHGWSLGPSRGSVVIAGAPQRVGFRAYSITFSENGLPNDWSWAVRLKATTQANTTQGTSGQVVFYEANGSYLYHALPGTGSTMTPPLGIVTVGGADRTIELRTYAVTFLESGLPNAWNWSVSLAGHPRSNVTAAGAGEIVFYEGNGSYGYRYGGARGFPGSGGAIRHVIVNGLPVTVDIPFTEIPALVSDLDPVPTTTEVGVPTSLGVQLAGGLTPRHWTLEMNGSGSTNLSGPNGSRFVFVPRAVGTYAFYLNATDAAGHTSDAQVNVTVDATLRTNLSASPRTIEVGTSSVLTVNVTGGVAPVRWTLVRLGTFNTNNTHVNGSRFTFAPATAGNYTFVLNATDHLGRRLSVATNVTVVPGLVTNLTASPARILVHGSSVLTLGFQGGLGSIAWQLTENGSAANLSGTVGLNYTFRAPAPGTYTFYLNATDGGGGHANASAEVLVPALRANLSARPTLTQVGFGSTLTISLADGVSPTAWTLQENGSVPDLANGSGNGTFAFAPAHPGTYTLYLNATDGAGDASSATTTVTVEPHVTARLSASPTTTEVGRSASLSVGVAFGVPGYTWTLTVNGSVSPVATGTTNGTYDFRPGAPGTYTFRENATDAQGFSSTAVATVTVAPALRAVMSANASTVSPGQNVTLTLTFSGGVLPVLWTLEKNGSTANLTGATIGSPRNASFVFSSTHAANYTFYLNATDAAGGSSTSTVVINVDPPAARPAMVGVEVRLPTPASPSASVARSSACLAATWVAGITLTLAILGPVASKIRERRPVRRT